jgi:GT2 family glycosyltransferase
VRNAILAEAQRRNADFIAMIDDDEVASPEWLANLLRTQRSTGADVVGGPVVQVFPVFTPEWFQVGFRRPVKPAGPTDLVDATGNVVMLCSSLDAQDWPEFDPAYGLSGGGDTEYFLRLRELGMRFAWSSDALVSELVEEDRLNVKWMMKRSYRHGIIRTRLKKRYRYEGTPGLGWIALNLAATPLFLALTAYPRLRIQALKRIAYAVGLTAGSIGMKYHEYASRH